ncbi:hypothetical protein BDU57DRAFT_511849 [Ampelomyces quisqualis]|uniref:Uncharacterized protein n=1 Tax=Ampelomyces quisqualis TaxID=50730 RepID=A0A6A5QT99_AMPQU|nr:hypothetical protein BDU57DRAFT_511849 [Ampelomyces quisqualis]
MCRIHDSRLLRRMAYKLDLRAEYLTCERCSIYLHKPLFILRSSVPIHQVCVFIVHMVQHIINLVLETATLIGRVNTW